MGSVPQASSRYSRMSPGWHSSTSQISPSVSKRTPLTLPDFSSETFCSVIPMRSASSFERILRRASMTSRLTMIGIAILTLDERCIFIGDAGGFHHDPGDRQQHAADNQRQILVHRQGDNKLATARRIVQRQRD